MTQDDQDEALVRSFGFKDVDQFMWVADACDGGEGHKLTDNYERLMATDAGMDLYGRLCDETIEMWKDLGLI